MKNRFYQEQPKLENWFHLNHSIFQLSKQQM